MKEYVVGLTNRRFIALRFEGKNAQVKEIIDYPLSSLPRVKAATGALFTHIKILDTAKPFVAKFHRLGMPGNREHSIAMAAALGGGG